MKYIPTNLDRFKFYYEGPNKKINRDLALPVVNVEFVKGKPEFINCVIKDEFKTFRFNEIRIEIHGNV